MASQMLRWFLVIINATKGTVAFAYLYDFKYSKWFTVPIFFVWETVISLNQEFCIFTGVPQLLLFIWGMAIYIFMLDGNVLNNLIMSGCFAMIYSTLSTAAIAIVSRIFYSINNSKPTIWLSGPGMDMADFLIYICCTIPLIYFAYRIVKNHIKNLLKKISSSLRMILFLILYVAVSIITIISYFSYSNKIEQASASVMVWGYAILIISIFLMSIVLISIIIARINIEQDILDQEISRQVYNYNELKIAHENLREIKHDLTNMIVAGGDSYKATILKYCSDLRNQISEYNCNPYGREEETKNGH